MIHNIEMTTDLVSKVPHVLYGRVEYDIFSDVRIAPKFPILGLNEIFDG